MVYLALFCLNNFYVLFDGLHWFNFIIIVYFRIFNFIIDLRYKHFSCNKYESNITNVYVGKG